MFPRSPSVLFDVSRERFSLAVLLSSAISQRSCLRTCSSVALLVSVFLSRWAKTTEQILLVSPKNVWLISKTLFFCLFAFSFRAISVFGGFHGECFSTCLSVILPVPEVFHLLGKKNRKDVCGVLKYSARLIQRHIGRFSLSNIWRSHFYLDLQFLWRTQREITSVFDLEDGVIFYLFLDFGFHMLLLDLTGTVKASVHC